MSCSVVETPLSLNIRGVVSHLVVEAVGVGTTDLRYCSLIPGPVAEAPLDGLHCRPV